MILDGFLSFDNALLFVAGTTGAIGTQPSTNVIDLGVTSGIPSSASGGGARDIGIGDDPAMKLMVLVPTTVTSGGAATLQIALQGAIDNGAGAPAAFSTWWSSPAYALATLTAGARLYDMDMPRPPDGIAIPRFLRMAYIIATATLTGGNISAFIVLDRMDIPYQGTNNAIMGGYPAGIVIAN
jgi:hypothetical protein